MQYRIEDLDITTKKIDIVVKLVKKFEPRYAKGYKVTNFLGVDPTGAIIIPFWNEDCRVVKVGDYIEIQNGYVSSYKNKLQLNIGRYGSFKHVDPPENFELSMEVPSELELKEKEVTRVGILETQTEDLSLQVFVKEVVNVRTVMTKYDGKEHRVVSFLVGDESGCIILELWDDTAEIISPGMVVRIDGAYVRTYKERVFLNISRSGVITPSEAQITINCANNFSIGDGTN